MVSLCLLIFSVPKGYLPYQKSICLRSIWDCHTRIKNDRRNLYMKSFYDNTVINRICRRGRIEFRYMFSDFGYYFISQKFSSLVFFTSYSDPRVRLSCTFGLPGTISVFSGSYGVRFFLQGLRNFPVLSATYWWWIWIAVRGLYMKTVQSQWIEREQRNTGQRRGSSVNQWQ